MKHRISLHRHAHLVSSGVVSADPHRRNLRFIFSALAVPVMVLLQPHRAQAAPPLPPDAWNNSVVLKESSRAVGLGSQWDAMETTHWLAVGFVPAPHLGLWLSTGLSHSRSPEETNEFQMAAPAFGVRATTAMPGDSVGWLSEAWASVAPPLGGEDQFAHSADPLCYSSRNAVCEKSALAWEAGGAVQWSTMFPDTRQSFTIRADAVFGGRASARTALSGSLSAEYRPTPVFGLVGSSDAVRLLDNGPWQNLNAIWAGGGIAVHPVSRVAFDLQYQQRVSGDWGHVSWSGTRIGLPASQQVAFRVQVGLGGRVSDDADGDHILDKYDQCPINPEDMDGFEDEDGCPDVDDDHDGFLDVSDSCPRAAEDMDGFEDEDGCPDFDNDNDGIADSLDTCPNQPEDRDGFQDTDGCPDLDDDQDGVPDASDSCRNAAEDRDGFQDDDGCPDPDNDGDGIPDVSDRCPLQPETLNRFQDEDGCPDMSPFEKRWAALAPLYEKPKSGDLDGVRFTPGTVFFRPGYEAVLQKLARQMRAYPNLGIEIRGHTDDLGDPAQNLRLGEQQAQAVVEYLVEQGVPPNRMQAIGVGGQKPVRENFRVQGRYSNRRVEITVVEIP